MFIALDSNIRRVLRLGDARRDANDVAGARLHSDYLVFTEELRHGHAVVIEQEAQSKNQQVFRYDWTLQESCLR